MLLNPSVEKNINGDNLSCSLIVVKGGVLGELGPGQLGPGQLGPG